jgi:hypothetical protein
MAKSSPSKTTATPDFKAERAALKTKKFRVGMAVRMVTPGTHLTRAGVITKIEEGEEGGGRGGKDALPMLVYKGKTKAGKTVKWRNRPSLVEAVAADVGAGAGDA